MRTVLLTCGCWNYGHFHCFCKLVNIFPGQFLPQNGLTLWWNHVKSLQEELFLCLSLSLACKWDRSCIYHKFQILLVRTSCFAIVLMRDSFGSTVNNIQRLLDGTVSCIPQSDDTKEADSDTYQKWRPRSEEHTSELQSRQYLVCRLLLEKKKC